MRTMRPDQARRWRHLDKLCKDYREKFIVGQPETKETWILAGVYLFEAEVLGAEGPYHDTGPG